MYKRCEEILNKLASEGKIKKPNFYFPSKQELKLKLKDILEDEVDEKYYLSEKTINKLKLQENLKHKSNYINNKNCCNTIDTKVGNDTHYSSYKEEVIRKYGIFDTEKSIHQAGSVYDENGLSPTLTTMEGGWRQPCIEIKSNINNLKIRKLTPRECWRLMGFNDEDFEKVRHLNSDSQLYKQSGNSIVVNVLVEVLRNLLDKEVK